MLIWILSIIILFRSCNFCSTQSEITGKNCPYFFNNDDNDDDGDDDDDDDDDDDYDDAFHFTASKPVSYFDVK